jgi:hypothetical protein
MDKLRGGSQWGQVGTLISVTALAVSGLSLWNAHEAQRMSYESSLPMLSETTELVAPVEPAKPINARIIVTNFGHTTAKEMEPLIRVWFGPASSPFVLRFDLPASLIPQSSPAERPPGDHLTIVTTNNVSLAHDHDVAAVLSGEYNFYVFGKIPFKDVVGHPHEFHFCRLVRATPVGADPMRVQKCPTFNDSY